MKIPETFRCHVTMRGNQCPCDLTLVNTFTFSLPKLDEKARRVGEKRASVKTLKSHAVCPRHAEMLKRAGYKLFRMGVVGDLVITREREMRPQEARERSFAARDQELQRFYQARQPRLGAALIEAGVRL